MTPFFIQSSDYGRNFNTWKKSLISTTGSTPSFGVDDIGVNIDTIGIDQALMDTESTPVVVSKGRLPVPPPLRANGFNKTAIPFPIKSSTSSHLVLNSADDAYVIYN
ncbi:uncharacterized protein EV422DRAFT_570836 [Fimicolochytrium jonesii]|uniref:uncharacterized protein n=1 Tax=Fimicolochytrium jonesii TaxID=1396493 RepID=UPI0022FEC131|nr:uncharacterized protein EV422DRAFT_570836 [Fimicolochytrium jonesii]KAI8817218.1 hypothetical protein EV422DRAFT_570836 [Fimicolochytrium jonesii]